MALVTNMVLGWQEKFLGGRGLRLRMPDCLTNFYIACSLACLPNSGVVPHPRWLSAFSCSALLSWHRWRPSQCPVLSNPCSLGLVFFAYHALVSSEPVLIDTPHFLSSVQQILFFYPWSSGLFWAGYHTAQRLFYATSSGCWRQLLTLKWPRYIYSRWCARGVPWNPPKKTTSYRNFAMKFAPYMNGL